MNEQRERRNGSERRQYDRDIPIWLEQGKHRDRRILEMSKEEMLGFSGLIVENYLKPTDKDM